MSIFNWFRSNKPTKRHTDRERLNASHVDSEFPRSTPDVTSDGATAPTLASHANGPKAGRIEHREHLHEVVRDSMHRAGILASGYKFKVLSHDGRGSQYLVMMDLADPLAGDAARQAEIEVMMAESAKRRHDLLIKAVYWRMSDQAVAGLVPAHQTASPNSVAPVPQPPIAQPVTRGKEQPEEHPRKGALQDEISAFKRAQANGTSTSVSVKTVKSARSSPAPSADFEDTQILD